MNIDESCFFALLCCFWRRNSERFPDLEVGNAMFMRTIQKEVAGEDLWDWAEPAEGSEVMRRSVRK
jgi:hypothetical protein